MRAFVEALVEGIGGLGDEPLVRRSRMPSLSGTGRPKLSAMRVAWATSGQSETDHFDSGAAAQRGRRRTLVRGYELIWSW